MNKKEFLKELNKKLKHLPENEKIDALSTMKNILKMLKLMKI
ncbi:hypothetical protein [Paraclostridium sordellii]|nr:hypothetical protein [Paeniclostridium sordellii]